MKVQVFYVGLILFVQGFSSQPLSFAATPPRQDSASVSSATDQSILENDLLKKYEVIREKPRVRWFDSSAGLFDQAKTQIAYQLIAKAQYTIDIEIYEMKDPKFRDLLIQALKRGVQIRIVKDSSTVGDSCSEWQPIEEKDSKSCRDEKNFVQTLQNLGATYSLFNKKELCGIEGKSCFEHGKVMIIDHTRALLSTGNFNSSNLCNLEEKPDQCNRDYSYVTRNKKVIEALSSIFEMDLKNKRWDFEKVISEQSAALTISPFSKSRLISFIQSAKQSLWIQNQYLNDPEWNEAILQAAERGVKVNVMLADLCAFGRPTELNQKRAQELFPKFEASGVQVKFFTQQIQVKGQKGYLHAKAMLVDERVAWVGSINGSVTSTEQNREFGVFFKGKKYVKLLLNTIRSDFENTKAIHWQQSLNCVK